MKRLLLAVGLTVLAAVVCMAAGQDEEATGGRVPLQVGLSRTAMPPDMVDALETMFEDAYPGIDAEMEITSMEAMVPRVVSGDVHDIAFSLIGNAWDLAAEGKILDLTDFYQTKAHDSDMTVAESLVTGAPDLMTIQGRRYALATQPAFMSLVVNEGMFEENGWKVPETYQELLDVSQKIKAKGIKPLGYTAVDWMNRNESIMFIPLVYEFAGMEQLIDMDNMVKGAWNRPAVVKALEVMQELIEEDVIGLEGLGMDGPQCQLEFVLGKSAMVTSGFWFEQEMREQMPDDAKYTTIPFPTDGLADAENVAVLSWFNNVLAWGATDQKEAALDFLRYVVSYEWQSYWGKVGKLTLLSNRRALEELSTGDDVSYFTKEVQELVANPRNELVQAMYMNWYKDQMRIPVQNAMDSVVSGDLTPRQAADAMEKSAEALRNDPEVTLRKR